METRNLIRNTHNPTKIVNRGSAAFMAREVLVDKLLLPSASIEDLKSVGIWSLLMTLFLLLNPYQRYPYQVDITDGIVTQDTIKNLLRVQSIP